jgi:hypothetical protein
MSASPCAEAVTTRSLLASKARAPDAAELMEVLGLEMTAATILAIEPLQREGEQWQRVFSAGQQRIDQRVVDLERARRALEPVRPSLDDLGIGPPSASAAG